MYVQFAFDLERMTRCMNYWRTHLIFVGKQRAGVAASQVAITFGV